MKGKIILSLSFIDSFFFLDVVLYIHYPKLQHSTVTSEVFLLISKSNLNVTAKCVS